MTAPSEAWLGFACLAPESGKYKQIKAILSSANFQHLEKCALDWRHRYQADLSFDTTCSIDLTRFTAGFDNLILQVAFSDGIYWIARIPYRTIDHNTRTSLLSEIATMKIIRQRTTIPIPCIYGFEITNTEAFGYPYILMEYLEGCKLDDGLATSIPQHSQTKVAKQLATVFTELQTLTFSRIGRLWCGDTTDEPVRIIPMAWHHSPGPLETSLEYFYNQRQGDNQDILTLHPNDPDWRTACWVLKIALAHIVIEDRVRGPFPLCHLDLHFGNLLFDDNYNLTGVIDWSNAQAAPLEQLSVCPELVVFPGRSEEDNRPILEFKKLVVRHIREIENGKTKYEDKEQPIMQTLDQQQQGLKRNSHSTSLSAYMSSESAEIMHRQYMASPNGSLWAAKRVAKLMYGEHVTWEQLRKVYGCMPLCHS